MQNRPNKKVYAAIFAHPDDPDFSCSGAFAKFAKAGNDCYYVILTNGSKGSNDPKVKRDWLIKTRRQEQLAAAKVLGIKDVIFLDYEDCELEVNLKTKGAVVEVLRKIRPDIVVTFDPSRFYSESDNYVNHPDHRACGEIVMSAVFPLSHSHLMYPDHINRGLKPHKTRELWLTNFEKANYFIDIEKTFNKKIEALSCHRSQLAAMKGFEKWVKKWALSMAKKSKKYKLAEGFIRFKLE